MNGIILLGFLLFALGIAFGLGRKRQIGAGWAFFFCLTLSPLVGFLIVMLSPKYYEANPQPSKAKAYWGWGLMGFFALGLIGNLMQLGSNPDAGTGLSISIGFIGLGYYLLERSKGKSFASEELVSFDEDED